MALQWPETLKVAAKENGGRPKWLPKQTYYGYLKGHRTPPIPTLRKLARRLKVRVGWLIEGEEPMAAAPSLLVVKRHLWQVNGVFADWTPPAPDDDRRAKQAFRAAFGKTRETEYDLLKPIVKLMFGDMLARIMNGYRTAGSEEVHDPAWRGELAGRAFDYFGRRALAIEPRAGFDDKPWTARAWLAAMLEQYPFWESGSMPAKPPF